MQFCRIILVIFCCQNVCAQDNTHAIRSFYMGDSVRVTIDKSPGFKKRKPTVVAFYALPNGNTTEQTMGKKMREGDDWHFDIQHIRAQTEFIRQEWPERNLVVIYLENSYKSWPLWKQKHPDFKERIPHIIDSLFLLVPGKRKEIYLGGHSGGGSLLFGYLAGVKKIPSHVKRISFIDSNYGYDSSYYPILKKWLQETSDAALNLFAYNDSVAIYNGKPVVSPTGGTWHRGHLLLDHFRADYTFTSYDTDSLNIYKSSDQRIQFFFKPNLNRGIYHTQQVELNGFIHSVFCGTKNDSKKYTYYGPRAYIAFIK